MFKSVFFILIGSLFFTVQTNAQEEWKLRKQKNGVSAFTRASEWSKFDEYKVTTTIDGSLSSFYALIKDFKNYDKLFKDSRDLEVYLDVPDRHILYIRTKTPFPSKDRDAVLDNKISYDKDHGILRIDISCTDEYYVPKAKIIQLNQCYGYWEVKEIGGGKIEITNQFSTDPAGKIPAFIINLKTVQNPIKSLLAIRELIQLPRYQGLTLSIN